MQYLKAEKIKLKDHFSEKWLQDIIDKDPAIIGLGEVSIYQRERKQSSGGRIDFLMVSLENNTMYEVEIMLGATDESHIIRTIEYWDLEKRRFPSREHKAVIIAENITNRFFNVIALMNKSIPIIAIQLNAIKHGDNVILDFVKVLDIFESPEDEEDLGLETVDRLYWENKSSKKSIQLLDNIVNFAKTEYSDLRITYNKHHVAIGTNIRNFLWIQPRKSEGYCYLEMLVDFNDMDETKSTIESFGGTYSIRKENVIAFSITIQTFNKSKDVVEKMILKSLKKFIR